MFAVLLLSCMKNEGVAVSGLLIQNNVFTLIKKNMLLENAYYTGNIVLPLNTPLTPNTGGVLVDKRKQFELQYMNVVVSALSRDPSGVRSYVRACVRACVRA